MSQYANYPKFKAWKANGSAPAAGYYLYTYDSGTTTPKSTYADSALVSANANPIVLDANGEANIFLSSGAYRFDLKTPAGGLVWTFDPVQGQAAGVDSVDSISQLRTLSTQAKAFVQVLGYYAENDGGGGLFYWNSTSTAADNAGTIIVPGSAPTTGRWIRVFSGEINVRWFGAKGDGTTNDYVALAAANTYAASLSSKGTLYFPPTSGSYLHNSNLTISDGVRMHQDVGGVINTPSGVILFTPVPTADRYTIYAGIGQRAFKQGRANELYPEWWGAIADLGVGDTDSTTALQKAITEHGQYPVTGGYNYGGLLKLATGTYLTSSPLRVTNNAGPVRIVGPGRNNTTIRVKTGSTAFPTRAVLEFPNNADVTGGVTIGTVTGWTNGSVVQGFTVDGNSLAGYGVLAITNTALLRDFRATRCTVRGADVGYGYVLMLDRCYFDNNSGDGARFVQGGSTNSILFNGCVFVNNTGIGLKHGEGVGVKLSNCTIETNRKAGIFLGGGVEGFSIDSCYFESNGADGITWDLPYVPSATTVPTYTGSIVASTTQTQAGGTALTSQVNLVSSVANDNDAVTLPTAAAGVKCCIRNTSASKILQVFPAAADKFSASALNASRTIAPEGLLYLLAADATTWNDDSTIFATERNLKADIIINGGDSETDMSAARECIGTVCNSTVNAGAATYHVYAICAQGLNIHGCARGTDGVTLLGVYGSHVTSAFTAVGSLSDTMHGINDPRFEDSTSAPVSKNIMVAPLGYDIVQASPQNIRIPGTKNQNLLESNMSRWEFSGGGTTATWNRSTTVKLPFDPLADVYELGAGTGTSQVFQWSIDAADYVDYQGRYCFMSIWLSRTAGTINGRVSLNPQGTARNMDMSGTGWQRMACVFKFPVSGTISFQVGKIDFGGSASGTIYAAKPVVAELGSDLPNLELNCYREVLRTLNPSKAASTTQTQGQGPLNCDVTFVNTVTNDLDTVTLRPAKIGLSHVVVNKSATKTLQVFPATGDNINGAGVNTAVTVEPGKSLTVLAVDDTNWYRIDLPNERSVRVRASGATAQSSVNAFVVETNTDTGMSLLAPDANQCNYAMGSPSNNFAAIWRWDYTSNTMTLAPNRASAETVLGYGAFSEGLRLKSTGALLSIRHQQKKGAAIASANDITLGTDGNVFNITGVTQINRIATANWQSGAVIILHPQSAITIAHNGAATGGGFALLNLAGAVNWAATAGSRLQLYFNGTDWWEVSRAQV